MMESQFEKLLVDLARSKVRYVTVGGLACALNGYVRATFDVDILIEPSSENIEMLLRAREWSSCLFSADAFAA